MHILVYKWKNTHLGRLIAFLLTFAFVVPLVTHYYLGKHNSGNEFAPLPFQSRTQKASFSEDTLADKAEHLKKEISELERIKRSLSNELRGLEGRRARVQGNIHSFIEKAENARNRAEKMRAAVGRAERELEMIKLAKEEARDCPQLPHLKLPKKLVVDSLNIESRLPDRNSTALCGLDACFDVSRCSYSSGFPVYVYDPISNPIGDTSSVDSSKIADLIKGSPHYMPNPNKACLYVVVVGSLQGSGAEEIETRLHSLSYWGGSGQNHFLLHLHTIDSHPSPEISSLNVNFGLALLAQSSFHKLSPYRQGFDLILPPVYTTLMHENVWELASHQLPASRKYLLSFQGVQGESGTKSLLEELRGLAKEAEDTLIETSCSVSLGGNLDDGQWTLCGDHGDRIQVLRHSTFSLVLGPSETKAVWDSTHVRLIEGLQTGAIPVVLTDTVVLPFSDLIKWKEAAIILPSARITELNFLLRTITNADILSMRLRGRFLWETYFASGKALVETALAVVRTRLVIPAPHITISPSPSVFTDENRPITNPADPDAVIQLSRPSPSYTRNFTVTAIGSYQMWNTPPGPFWLFPSSPFDPVLPSSAPFYNSAKGFDLIGKGEGGAGTEFSRSLGGNYPKEQFTVVILTYERDLVLMEALQRLVGLQYLNKVVVIWNSPNPPAPSLRWPDIGVPLHVIQVARNSLNNRFIPYDVIETDAIFSLDDDINMTHEEILLAFRVWRESRDRLVGFPGRYHAWDVWNGGWLYNSNHSCELSMVLTGAAFIHKYYAYLYTQWMPQIIRDKVDEFMNCEDIAMNFLISHITRKPPIKVTSRWTFSCPGCKIALWSDNTHFEERHKCLNFFAKVYGYMPLLRTQFRADSVLFKTRIPHDKSKCFKYV